MIYSLWAFCAGMAFTIQSGLNSQLRQVIGNPIQASFFSYLGGTVTMLICLIFGSMSVLPSVSILGKIRWWQMTGGMFGAFYVYAIIMTVLKIGSANMFSLIVAGQLLLAVIFDHFGLLGFNVHKLTVLRLLGVVVMVMGVYMIQKN